LIAAYAYSTRARGQFLSGIFKKAINKPNSGIFDDFGGADCALAYKAVIAGLQTAFFTICRARRGITIGLTVDPTYKAFPPCDAIPLSEP
jgi:hypothetical protein